MKSKFGAQINLLASIIRKKKNIGILRLAQEADMSPYSLLKLKPFLLDMFPDIQYYRREFFTKGLK